MQSVFLGLSNIALGGLSWPMFFLTNLGLGIMDPSWRTRALVRMYVIAVVILVDKMEDAGDETHIMEAPIYREEPGRHCGAVLINQTIDGRTLDANFGHAVMDKTITNHTEYAVMLVRKKKSKDSAYKSFFASLFQMLGRRKTAIGLAFSLIVGLMFWD